MYLRHTITFKGRNHLIGYLANLLWSLETIAHAKAHYERACHYEMTTLLSMVCNVLYTITLMTCCTGKIRDTLDLVQNCKWCPFGFGLPIWCPFGFGTWRVCVERYGPPKPQKALHGSPPMSKDYQRSTFGTRMIHLVHYAQQDPRDHHTLGRCPRTCIHHLNP